MLYAIWYHLYNLKKNMKKTHFLVTLLHGCFLRFLNCTDDIKSCKASHMYICLNNYLTSLFN